MIVSIFATHADGSLNVPRIPEDRALLKRWTQGKIVICGSTVAKQIPKSLKKIVISRVSGQEYCDTVEEVMNSLDEKNDYIIYGGHRIYDVANHYADVIVNIIVDPKTPRAERGQDDIYGIASVPDIFELVDIRDLGKYTEQQSDTGHIVKVYTNPMSDHFDVIYQMLPEDE